MSIHTTAIIENGAELGEGVSIGPFCQVSAKARLNDGVTLQSHVVVQGSTEIGARTIVHPFAVLGGPPQHLAHKGEETSLVIGTDSIIREQVTMNAGTIAGGSVTKIGNGGFFMIGSHVAHDCKIGDSIIVANNAAIGGHVSIGDNVFIGALCGVHQFCRIGSYAFAGGCAAVVSDIIPYASALGNRAQLTGLNIIGMKRRGMAREVIHDVRSAYLLLFANDDTFKERVARVRDQYAHREEIMRIVNFIYEDGSRPLMTPAR